MAEINPVHPGEVLMEEFLEPLGVTQHRLAVEIGVPPRRINEIVHGKRRITADTALRLARYFGTTDRFWLNLQTRHDLEIEKDHLGAALEAIRPLKSPCPHPTGKPGNVRDSRRRAAPFDGVDGRGASRLESGFVIVERRCRG